MAEEFVSNPFKKDDKKSLGEVVISQISIIAKEGSKEMKPGYRTQSVMDGKIINITIPDQRLTFIQCVKTLHDLLLFYFDKDMEDALEEINKQLNSSGKNFVKMYITQEDNPKLKRFAEEKGLIPSCPLGDKIIQRMMNYQVEVYRTMFQELVLLFKRKNELSGKRTLGYK